MVFNLFVKYILTRWVVGKAGISRYSGKDIRAIAKKSRSMEYKKSMSQKLRMDGRDYSRLGWYFVTLGSDYHKQMFGTVEKGVMRANALGLLVEERWAEIPKHYGHIALSAWQVMPNHFHGLVRITKREGKGLGEVMNVFKGAVTREWRKRKFPAVSPYSEREREQIWAPNYYDVICFDAMELEVKERYIRANPRRWALRDVPKGIVGNMRYKGNVALLDAPGERLGLRISRKMAAVEISRYSEKKLPAFEGLVCSTFFSPGEKACLETLQKGKARIIWVLPMAMPEKIATAWMDAFLEGRALWLSAFSDELKEASRSSCEQANRWIELFCGTRRERHGREI